MIVVAVLNNHPLIARALLGDQQLKAATVANH
jgi:hypothetical protein